MKLPGSGPAAAVALLLSVFLVLPGCDAADPARPAADTKTAQGAPLPAPPLPPGAVARVAQVAPGQVVAVWVADHHVVAAHWSKGSGWSAPQALETLHGEASNPQLASNGRGEALAVWRHTVGSIESLRFARRSAQAWSVPDVVPGALPRPRAPGEADDPGALQLTMEANGHALARWPSGFADDEVQSARFDPQHGFSRAQAAPASAPAPASPASSGR